MQTTQGTGAYGLKLSFAGREVPEGMLGPVGIGWTDWTMSMRVAETGDDPSWADADLLGPDRARYRLEPQGFAAIDLENRRTELTLPHVPSVDELLHPYLATTAATTAWWLGRFALHGSCATNGCQTLAFLGDRGQGKSSTLAWLVRKGWRAVSDDLLVMDGTSVLAGPRFFDLRRATAEAWGMGDYLGVVGTRERWRVYSGSVAPSTPLSAFVQLAWGDRLTVERVPAAARLASLFSHRTLDVEPTTGIALLRLMSVPILTVTRPRNLGSIAPTIEAILDAI